MICYSQRTSKVSATYTYYAPETMSVEEAKRVALDRAKIQAIADEFGTVVSQSTTTVISNKNGESDTQVFSLGGSDVKGEWIETIGAPEFRLMFDSHFLVVTCTVKGKARQCTQSKLDFTATLLRNGHSLKYQSDEFSHGDDMYLHFISAYSGYLVAYWIDMSSNMAYRILPYRSDDSSLLRIKRDKEYVFFSSDEGPEVDEYNLTCGTNIEYNELSVFFSENPFVIPPAISDSSGLYGIPLDKYEKWKLRLIRDGKIKVKSYNITIYPK